jgi:hypothetical protein
MSTGIKWRAVAVATGLTFTLFFTGCGGDNDSGGGTVAPASLEGRSYDFSPNTGGQTAVSFTSSTAYKFQHETGAVSQGNYEATQDGNKWNVTLVADTGGQQVYEMTFANGTSGNFVLHREGEPDQFGPFTARTSAIPSGGDTTGEPPGTTTTGPSNEYNGFAPVSISARKMFATRRFTSTGPNGQTHEYTFNNGMFHDSDPPEESDGTYQYTAGNSSATLTLNYTGPAGFVGDQHHLNLTFTAKDSGVFTSTYTRADSTQITINGDFQFDPIP